MLPERFSDRRPRRLLPSGRWRLNRSGSAEPLISHGTFGAIAWQRSSCGRAGRDLLAGFKGGDVGVPAVVADPPESMVRSGSSWSSRSAVEAILPVRLESRLRACRRRCSRCRRHHREPGSGHRPASQTSLVSFHAPRPRAAAVNVGGVHLVRRPVADVVVDQDEGRLFPSALGCRGRRRSPIEVCWRHLRGWTFQSLATTAELSTSPVKDRSVEPSIGSGSESWIQQRLWSCW